MKRLVLPLFAFLFALAMICLFNPKSFAQDYKALIDSSEARVYQSPSGEKLPYRLFKPDNYDPAQKYPLIIFLHGAGERGTNNISQLVHAQVLSLISGENRTKNPSFLIAPQCENGKRWCEVDWSQKTSHVTPEKPSDGMKCLFEIVDALRKEFSLDPSRLYVTGLSMGGYGTCDFVAWRGSEVAAYAPLCGGADNDAICRFKNASSWFFHGDKDGAVPTERSRSAVAALKAAGCDVRYTELPGRGHGIWTEAYYTSGFADWLFSQTNKK